MTSDNKGFPQGATIGSSNLFGSKKGDAPNTFSSSTTLFKTDGKPAATSLFSSSAAAGGDSKPGGLFGSTSGGTGVLKTGDKPATTTAFGSGVFGKSTLGSTSTSPFGTASGGFFKQPTNPVTANSTTTAEKPKPPPTSFGKSSTNTFVKTGQEQKEQKAGVNFNPFGLSDGVVPTEKQGTEKQGSSEVTKKEEKNTPTTSETKMFEKPAENFGLVKGQIPKAFSAVPAQGNLFGSKPAAGEDNPKAAGGSIFTSTPSSSEQPIFGSAFGAGATLQQQSKPSEAKLFGAPTAVDNKEKKTDALSTEKTEQTEKAKAPVAKKQSVEKWEKENKKLLPELKKAQEKAAKSAKAFKPMDFTPVFNMLIDEIWKTYDTNQDGKLQKDEARNFIKRIVEKTDEHIEAANEQLKRKEVPALPGKQFDQKFKEFWEKYDTNKDGCLSKKEMTKFLQDVVAI